MYLGYPMEDASKDIGGPSSQQSTTQQGHSKEPPKTWPARVTGVQRPNLRIGEDMWLFSNPLHKSGGAGATE